MSGERYTFIRDLPPILEEWEDLTKRLKPVRQSLRRWHRHHYPGFALPVDLAVDWVVPSGKDLDKATARLRCLLNDALADPFVEENEQSSLAAESAQKDGGDSFA